MSHKCDPQAEVAAMVRVLGIIKKDWDANRDSKRWAKTCWELNDPHRIEILLTAVMVLVDTAERQAKGE